MRKVTIGDGRLSFTNVGAGSADSARLAQAYRGGQPLSDEDLAGLARAVEWLGGRSCCVGLADDLLSRALRTLRAAGPMARTAELAALARLCAGRDC